MITEIFSNAAETQRGVSVAFRSTFLQRGFRQEEPVAILADSDPTLLFTNATIVPWKHFLVGTPIPENGIYLEQPCLRVQNLRHIGDEGYDPPYMSYFKMPGVLAPAHSAGQVCDAAWEFFVEAVGIRPEHVRVLCSGQTSEFDRATWFRDRGAVVEVDSRPPDFYRWRYGMDGVRGVGLTFSIRNEGREFDDVGNIVVISRNGHPVAVEFGIGLETFIDRAWGLRSPFEAALISSVIPYIDRPENKMLQDCVAIATVLAHLGVLPGRGGSRSVLRKAIRALEDISHDMSRQQLLDAVTCFQVAEFRESGAAYVIEAELDRVVQASAVRNQRYRDYVANQKRLFSRGLLSEFELSEKIARAKITYKIKEG